MKQHTCLPPLNHSVTGYALNNYPQICTKKTDCDSNILFNDQSHSQDATTSIYNIQYIYVCNQYIKSRFYTG